MPMLQNVYYQQDANLVFLRLDGGLRQICEASVPQTFINLYGRNINQSEMNQFQNRESAPYAIGHPLKNGANVYTLENDPPGVFYLSDEFPWNPEETVLRRIVPGIQMQVLGFTPEPEPTNYTGSKSIGVPLALYSGWNLHLQTFFAGYHFYYNHLCHPENPMNPYFRSWLGNQFNKATVKDRIIQTQHQIDELAGEVPVQTPSFSPVDSVQRLQRLPVTISCATPNAEIYYSINGDGDPIPGTDTRYTGPVQLDLSEDPQTLRAIAEYPDSIGTSSVAEVAYSYEPITIADPTFFPPEGEQTNSTIRVEIGCSTPDTEIFYTTNGEKPNAQSPRYLAPVELSLSTDVTTLKAIAKHRSYDFSSEVSEAEYSYLPPQVSTPTFDPPEQQQVSPRVAVTISCEDENATIHYTTDNTTPTANSPIYGTPVTLDLLGANKTLRAIAVQSGSRQSEEKALTYQMSLPWGHAWPLSEDADDLASAQPLILAATNITYVLGRNGDAANFAGDSRLTATSSNNMKNSSFSVAVWVKATSIPTVAEKFSAIWSFEQESGRNGPGVYIRPNGMVEGQTLQSNDEYVQCTTGFGTVSAGEWFHCVLVAGDRNALRLYINGQQVAEQPFDGTISQDACYTFNVGADPKFPLTGQIARLYYADQPFTAQQVQELFSSEFEYVRNDPGLVECSDEPQEAVC